MPKWYRLNSSGAWAPLKSIYRLNSSGAWGVIKKIYRLNSSGQWLVVHSTAEVPVATTSPTLTNGSGSSTNFYGGDVLTLTRGAYTNTTADSNTTYRMTIYKGTDPNLAVNDTNWTIVKQVTYTGATSTSTTSISSLASDLQDVDAFNGYYYVGEVKVNNDASNPSSDKYDFVTTPKVLSRISFLVSGLTATGVTDNDANFSWNITGISTDAYIYTQKLVIRQTGPSGTIVENISLSTSARSYNLLNSTNLLPSTQYYAEVQVIANDGWNTNTGNETYGYDAYIFSTTAVPPSGSNFVASDVTTTPTPSGLSISGSTSNIVSFSWTNGSPLTSVTLFYSGTPTTGSLTDVTSPFITSHSTGYYASGILSATVQNTNNNKIVRLSWNQLNALSYRINYTIGSTTTNLNGNASGSSASANITVGATAQTVVFNSITLYASTGQTGISTTYTLGGSTYTVNATDKTGSVSNSAYLTYTPPAIPPSTPTNGGGTYQTGTNYITNATFTSSSSGTTPITYSWIVYSSFSSSGPWSYRNGGSIVSSSLSTTLSIPQQSWNQASFGSWAQYNVAASNSAGSSPGSLVWVL